MVGLRFEADSQRAPRQLRREVSRRLHGAEIDPVISSGGAGDAEFDHGLVILREHLGHSRARGLQGSVDLNPGGEPTAREGRYRSVDDQGVGKIGSGGGAKGRMLDVSEDVCLEAAQSAVRAGCSHQESPSFSWAIRLPNPA